LDYLAARERLLVVEAQWLNRECIASIYAVCTTIRAPASRCC